MTDQAISSMRREPTVLRLIKAAALIRESWVGMVGLGIIVFWAVVAILADVIAPFPPNATGAPMTLPGGPALDGSGIHWLGTDQLGRDILSRIIHGSRQVLLYAPLATLCAYAVGIPMGLAAGYRRGLTDDVLSFIANVILSFPVLVLYIIIIATIGASGINIIIAVTFASAPGIMRIVRGLVLDLRNREYVFAAETRGESAWRIMLVEILPNARGPLIVDGCLRLGYVIITIGTLGFLGLGLPPPDPDWGKMITEARAFIQFMPHMAIFPCIAISSLVLGFNLLADGLREVSLRD
ncbi:MAG TPA: ABC transporter permease [Kiloniellaceae bacterium]|nr:ABC transporter permease [Kiloniellaceae bacterium]HIP78342.1 ABC transporter permease [Kiloniellaceae bacterium]